MPAHYPLNPGGGRSLPLSGQLGGQRLHAQPIITDGGVLALLLNLPARKPGIY